LRGLTNKLFECPGVRIVRQYKNDGKEKYYCPEHLLINAEKI